MSDLHEVADNLRILADYYDGVVGSEEAALAQMQLDALALQSGWTQCDRKCSEDYQKCYLEKWRKQAKEADSDE